MLLSSPSKLAGDESGLEAHQAADGEAESMLCSVLVMLYVDATETDVRLGLLRVALQVLQRHGACLCYAVWCKQTQGGMILDLWYFRRAAGGGVASAAQAARDCAPNR